MQIYTLRLNKYARQRCNALLSGVSFLHFDRCALDTLEHVRKPNHETATQTNRDQGSEVLKINAL